MSLAESTYVRIVVVDALGREVARPVSGRLDAGLHTVALAVGGLPPGVYAVVATTAGGQGIATTRFTVAR